MENLTRERAHDLCVEMWNDIAENGYTDKEDSYLSSLTDDCNYCFACDYYNNDEHSCATPDGGICPFRERGNMFKSTPCEDAMRSPYRAWQKNHKQEHAIAIADLFIDELK